MGENNKRPVELIIIAAICVVALIGMIATVFQLNREGAAAGDIAATGSVVPRRPT